ncbi:MAG: helix-turn-helix transcriptional regulator [Prevotella sp.]|nr:helix-turn-helix transcriptional regulator [Prevotella sp.]
MVEIKGKDIVFRIDSVLKKRNLKRKAVADAVGISLQPFTSWANRGSIPGADIAYHIAEYLDVSVDWLLTGIEKTQDSNLPPPEIIELAEDIYRLPAELQEVIIDNVEKYKQMCFKLEKESTQGIG